MITNAHFQNFKALRDVAVTFDRLTVIVGPNSSGKSSILEGVDLVCRAALTPRGELNDSPPRSESSPTDSTPLGGLIRGARHPSWLYHRGGHGNLVVSFTGHWNGTTYSFRLQFVPGTHNGDATPRTAWRDEVTFADGPQPAEGIWKAITLAEPQRLKAIRPAVLLQLDPRRLAAASHSDTVPPTMRPDGTGLASSLAYLALNRPDEFQELQAALRQVIPSVRRLRFDRGLFGEPTKETVLFDFDHAPNVPADLVSEGTILVLGLLTCIMGPSRPGLILLDDLDHGLHPKAQKELVQLLRKLLAIDPELQIIATSHSPYVLHSLEAKEIRLTSLRDDGSVACARLDEHPDFAKWNDVMSPGEFWSHVGEDWVAKRQATGSAR